VNYWSDSVKYVFSTAAQEAQADSIGENADRILDYLVKNGRSSRSDISIKVFSRHLSKTQLDEALESLLNATPPRIEVEQVRPKDGFGRATSFYSAI
jgi:putative DNA primase/helicase